MSKRPSNRGTVLNVPFKDKERAKELGAKWDPDIKKWFIPPGVSKESFSQWIPDKNLSQNN